MKFKLGIYYKPDTLEMIEVISFYRRWYFRIEAWTYKDGELVLSMFSEEEEIRNNFTFLGEL